MSAINWKKSLELVLKYEGNFTNNPNDPGGATNKGITQAVYDAYRKLQGKQLRSVKYIDDLEVSDIYYNQYWKRMRGDSLPSGLDYAVFDFSVNSGTSRAIKLLQKQVGAEADGVIGMITLSKIVDATNTSEKLKRFINKYINQRVLFLRELYTFKTFGAGWLNRVLGYQTKPGQPRQKNGVLDESLNLVK